MVLTSDLDSEIFASPVPSAHSFPVSRILTNRSEVQLHILRRWSITRNVVVPTQPVLKRQSKHLMSHAEQPCVHGPRMNLTRVARQEQKSQNRIYDRDSSVPYNKSQRHNKNTWHNDKVSGYKRSANAAHILDEDIGSLVHVYPIFYQIFYSFLVRGVMNRATP